MAQENFKNPLGEIEKYLLVYEKKDEKAEAALGITFDMETYRTQEDALKYLFEKFPSNTKMEEVLVKVSVLDAFYSTQTRKHVPFYKVAEKIISVDFDSKIKNGNQSLVSQISDVEYEDKIIHLLSFASKYCAMSDFYGAKTDAYSLYDSNVVEMLKEYGCKFKTSSDKAELYDNYRKAIETFREKFNLQKFNFRQIDQYLWLKGKIEL